MAPRSFSNLMRLVVLAATGMLLVACSPTISKPRLLSPGPAPTQRYNAGQFDPYPISDLGPDMSDARPIDFQTPRNAVTRARQFSSGERAAATPNRTPLGGAVFIPQTVQPVLTPPPVAPSTPLY